MKRTNCPGTMWYHDRAHLMDVLVAVYPLNFNTILGEVEMAAEVVFLRTNVKTGTCSVLKVTSMDPDVLHSHDLWRRLVP